jgi:anti-sigma regulatory factor (Ser/Thr protein kinase)
VTVPDAGAGTPLHVTTDGPHDLSASRRALGEWLTRRGVGPEVTADVVLTAGELLANAVEHAHVADRPAPVSMTARIDAGSVVLRVADTGSWRPPHHAAERGRGLAIALSLAGSIDIAREDPGTSVSAVFAVSPVAAHPARDRVMTHAVR